MANVTHLPTAKLTSAHRAVIARIQDRCIDISLDADSAYYAFCNYSGHVHSLTVSVLDRRKCDADADFIEHWREVLYLPPDHHAPADALDRLAGILDQLESYLPGGAA